MAKSSIYYRFNTWIAKRRETLLFIVKSFDIDFGSWGFVIAPISIGKSFTILLGMKLNIFAILQFPVRGFFKIPEENEKKVCLHFRELGKFVLTESGVFPGSQVDDLICNSLGNKIQSFKLILFAVWLNLPLWTCKREKKSSFYFAKAYKRVHVSRTTLVRTSTLCFSSLNQVHQYRTYRTIKST